MGLIEIAKPSDINKGKWERIGNGEWFSGGGGEKFEKWENGGARKRWWRQIGGQNSPL